MAANGSFIARLMMCLRSALLLVPLALGAGCASDAAYRQAKQCSAACDGTSSVEFRSYQTADSQPGEAIKGNYILGFVEFDDQGWFHDKHQRTALFDAVLKDRKANPDNQYLIVTYAHGWKHNAGKDDENVRDFRKLLEQLDALEQVLASDPMKQRKARKVVGVYLGWRGASVTLPLLENVTFWTRKNAGERVGDRSAKQLLVELNEFRAYLNGTAPGSTEKQRRLWERSDRLAGADETQLILIGHSFGGLVMYHALYTELIDRALTVERRKDDDAYHFGLAKSFGDFILLVNPAFEGAAYEPLYSAAMSRCYPGNQRPALAIVTSKTDWATGWAFPAGRLYTYFQSAPQDGERDTVVNTVGHLSRYITHDLTYAPREARESVEKTKGLPAASRKAAEQTAREIYGGLKDVEQKGETSYDGVRVKAVKQPQPKYPKNFPYLVMSADKELIDGHNDIWNERFRNFVISFVSKEIMGIGLQAADTGGGGEKYPPFWLNQGLQCTPARATR